MSNPNDFVRLEIATALKRDIRVIPVLVQKASMPKAEDLPDDLAQLLRRNQVELSDLRWQNDVDQLICVMERVLAKREEAARLARAARHAEEERLQEEEAKLRGEEQKQRLLAEEAAKQRATEERHEAEERERGEAQEQAHAENEGRKQEATETRQRAEEERQKQEEDEERKREAAEIKQRREKEERQGGRRTSVARFGELNLAPTQEQLDEFSIESRVGEPRSMYKNRRVVVTVLVSLIVLVVATLLIWLTRGHGNSSSANQATAQASKSKPDFSTPNATAETFIAAAASRDVDLLAKCFLPGSDWRKRDLDALATFAQSAQVDSVVVGPDVTRVGMVSGNFRGLIVVKKAEDGWRIVSLNF